MSRKTISTAHSVIVCAVCGRNLLRGEHAEPFITGGQRRLVCELCTPRAVNEGWLREGFDDVGVRPVGRSRSLFDRLRQWRDDELFGGEQDEPEHSNGQAYDEQHHAAERHVHAVPTNAELKMARAVELFNSSEHKRTISGVARSLGLPTVSVRPSATEGAVVTIVAAWEITWYRFEVDLGNEAAGVRRTDQGSVLDELDPEDLSANGVASDDGTLAIA